MRSGIVSKKSEMGSTVGRSAAPTTTIAIPMRRFRRSVSEVRTPSRTSARMKIGSVKTRPIASSVYATNV
jgi:hypothetical protein